ncbi:hypothetical protein BHM03_00058412, partial [Ensete ventricosum]
DALALFPYPHCVVAAPALAAAALPTGSRPTKGQPPLRLAPLQRVAPPQAPPLYRRALPLLAIGDSPSGRPPAGRWRLLPLAS